MAANPKTIENSPWKTLFAVIAGLFLFVAALKFGAPVVLDQKITPPGSALEVFYESWPIHWGFLLLAPLVATGLVAVSWKNLNLKLPLLLPLAWLVWNLISASESVNPPLSALTLKYFAACVLLFYLGYFGLDGVRNPWPVWAGLGLALCWMVHVGFEQHFGGLEATRRMVNQLYEKGESSALLNDPTYQARLASSRIFATFSNADAFAGAIELLLPVTLVFLWSLTPKVRPAMRWAFVIILGGCALACLYWTRSKAGWLVTMGMGLAAVWHTPIPPKWWQKIGLWALVIIAVAGLARLRDSLSAQGNTQAVSMKKGQVSVRTRLAYWRGALEIVAKSPLLGSGPGTFATAYAKVKRPDDDFSHLCHNDYLEQASDSGLPGAILYAGMVGGILLCTYRTRVEKSGGLTIPFALWLGLTGIATHCLVDYHLYVGSLAWPMFFLWGFLLNSRR